MLDEKFLPFEINLESFIDDLQGIIQKNNAIVEV